MIPALPGGVATRPGYAIATFSVNPMNSAFSRAIVSSRFNNGNGNEERLLRRDDDNYSLVQCTCIMLNHPIP